MGADVSPGLLRGARQDGVNYLVPVDACLERDVDVRFETVTLNDLLVSTVGASLRLVILDACRNNPLARSMQHTTASRSVSGGSFGDLNEDLLGDETLLAYAAAAGTTAADGRDRNSPYTSALLSHLETPLEFLRRHNGRRRRVAHRRRSAVVRDVQFVPVESSCARADLMAKSGVAMVKDGASRFHHCQPYCQPFSRSASRFLTADGTSSDPRFFQ